MHPVYTPCAAAFLATLVALGAAEAQQPIATDSAGVNVIRIARVLTTSPSWTLDTPGVQVGAGKDGPPEPLFRVTSLVREPNGTVAAATAGSRSVLLFRKNGSYFGESGREGGGPGEYRYPILSRDFASDSLLVFDPELSRLSFLDSLGTFGRSIGVRPPVNVGMLVRSEVYGRSLDNRIVVREASSYEPSKVGISRTTDAYVTYNFKTTPPTIDTIAVLPGNEVLFSRFQGRPVFSQLPFLSKSIAAFDGTHLYYSGGKAFRIRVYDLAGRLTRIIVCDDLPGESLGRGDYDAWVDEYVGGVASQYRAASRRFLQSLYSPWVLPAIDKLLADGSGHLWVRLYSLPTRHTPVTWLILNSTGVPVAKLETSRDFLPMWVDQRGVLGVAWDADSVESIVSYRISR
jgi:hypothetical protein